jgi:hypothetical protein
MFSWLDFSQIHFRNFRNQSSVVVVGKFDQIGGLVLDLLADGLLA